MQIKEHRVRIREEGDNHPDFGLEVEEKIKNLLSTANLTTTKQSRTRRKIDESLEMETKLGGGVVAAESMSSVAATSKSHSSATGTITAGGKSHVSPNSKYYLDQVYRISYNHLSLII